MKPLEPRKADESAKDYLSRYVEWLTAHGEEVIANYQSGALKEQDHGEMYFLARSTEWLPRKCSEVIATLDGRLEGDEADRVFDSLATLLASANNIGHHAMFSVSALPRYQRLQRHRMVGVRASITEQKKQQRKEAILAECNGVAMFATETFADSIRDGVKERLGPDGEKGCGKRTIARDIADILKEREEGSRHS